MSAEDLEKYETEMELQLYREYRDIVRQFDYVVETERRFYLANAVDVQPRSADGEVWFELTLTDAHAAALDRHGPCPQHRMRFVNVARARDAHAARALEVPSPAAMVDDGGMSEVQAGRPGRPLATASAEERAR